MINPQMHLVPALFSAKGAKKAIRTGYGEGLMELGKTNKRVVALTADLKESTQVEAFAQAFPERFWEMGVAEQNMMGVAAGMALEGMIPFVNSYAVFNPGRNWEQLRVSVAYSRANVKVAGHHAGLVTGPDGATHQALEDIAITRVLPNLTVIVPADAEEARKATIEAAAIKGPVYLRLARPNWPMITTAKTPFQVGKANVLRTGKKVTIVACGTMVFEALRAAEEVDGEVINLHTIKPLDIETLVVSAKKTGKVVTVEEHQVNGGMGGAVAEALMEHYPVPLKRMGVRDTFGESGEMDELLVKYGLGWEEIVGVVKSFEVG